MARVYRACVYGSVSTTASIKSQVKNDPNASRTDQDLREDAGPAGLEQIPEQEDDELEEIPPAPNRRSFRYRSLSQGHRRKPEIIYYDDSDSEDDKVRTLHYSSNFVHYVTTRERGISRSESISIAPSPMVRNVLLQEVLHGKLLRLDGMNKIFCSSWLNDSQVVFGTKCNQLCIYDLNKNMIHTIPTLPTSSHPLPQPGGIHSLAYNPSNTLMATGARNSNDIAIYEVPSFTPYCVGEDAHQDYIFDLVWLDDEFLVSGSRDSKVALWRVREEKSPTDTLPVIRPYLVKPCKSAEKVRALAYNKNMEELAALSLDGFVHVFDVRSFRQTMSKRLSHNTENVCLAYQPELNLYAAGSRSHVMLFDGRTMQDVRHIPSLYPSSSVRSLSFSADLVTMGTGLGRMMFYDLRGSSYLSKTNSPITLGSCGPCLASYGTEPANISRLPAIYTHCFDRSGTRLFTAGGPLEMNFRGSYAALWQ